MLTCTNTLYGSQLLPIEADRLRRTLGYSDVVAVKVVRAPSGISVYPSPAIQDVTLEFASTRGEAASLQVSDVIGQLVLEEAITLDKGMVSRILPVKC